MPHRLVRHIIQGQAVLIAPARATVSEAARLMKQAKVGAIMIVEDARLVGIFTERDALFRVIAEGRDPATTPVAEAMTRDPRTVPPDKPFGHALHIMYEGGFRHVPVVENGRPIGMVSARDVLGPEIREFADELRRRDHISEII